MEVDVALLSFGNGACPTVFRPGILQRRSSIAVRENNVLVMGLHFGRNCQTNGLKWMTKSGANLGIERARTLLLN